MAIRPGDWKCSQTANRRLDTMPFRPWAAASGRVFENRIDRQLSGRGDQSDVRSTRRPLTT
jgi:hypothetical protein